MDVIQHLVFGGAYHLTLDEKHRLLIPADVRKEINPNRDGNAFYAIEGSDGRLCLYPEAYYKALMRRVSTGLMPGADWLAFFRRNLGLAEKIELDRTGRILLSEEIRSDFSIGKEVTLWGVLDHLELWNRADFAAEKKSLRQRGPELVMKWEQMKEEPKASNT